MNATHRLRPSSYTMVYIHDIWSMRRFALIGHHILLVNIDRPRCAEGPRAQTQAAGQQGVIDFLKNNNDQNLFANQHQPTNKLINQHNTQQPANQFMRTTQEITQTSAQDTHEYTKRKETHCVQTKTNKGTTTNTRTLMSKRRQEKLTHTHTHKTSQHSRGSDLIWNCLLFFKTFVLVWKWFS